jgi:regulator of sigma E protease
MYNFATAIVGVIIVLGVMVFIHELGHFLAAKYFGIRVETFSIGFGKRLWGFERGGTDYRISALPFGGYVKMSGENPDDPTSGAPDEFQMKPRWQRFIVAFMGPAFNIVLSIALLTGLYMYRFPKPSFQDGPTVIGFIDPGSPADRAGLKSGDRILQVGDQDSPNWEDIFIKVATSLDREVQVTVERDGQRLNVAMMPIREGREMIGSVGWGPRRVAKIQTVEPSLPAGKAGLQPGDIISEINGQPVSYWPMVAETINNNQGKPMKFVISRGTEMIPVELTPVMTNVDGNSRWRVGMSFTDDMVIMQLGPAEAFRESLAANKKFGLLIFDALAKLVTREVSPRTLEGPIGIARLSGMALRQSFADLINLMAMISLNLGIFNLLPIPVLDGGMILMLLIEGTIRRDLSMKLKERVMQAGFALILLVAVFTIFNDILKYLPERFQNMLP